MEIKLEELVGGEEVILRFLKNCQNSIHLYEIKSDGEQISVITDGYQKELDDIFTELSNYILNKKS